MRRTSSLVLTGAVTGLSVLVLAAAKPRVPSTSLPPCATSSPVSEETIGWVKKLVTATDAESMTKRATYQLPAVAEKEVALVSDGATCEKATAAFNKIPGGDPAGSPQPLWVIKVGPTRYMVVQKASQEGAQPKRAVFNENFEYLTMVKPSE